MDRGSMMGDVLIILFLGWMATRTRHQSHSIAIAIFCSVLACGILAFGISEGYYWSVFPTANYYPEDDWRFLAMTKNKWLAIAIGVIAFTAPEMWWRTRARFWPVAHFRAFNKSPQCTLRIWPKSTIAEVSVRNIANGAITIRVVQAVNSLDRHIALKSEAGLLGRSVDYLETVVSDYRASNWYPPPEVWVHGEHVNGLSWSCRCKVDVHWPK